MLDFLLITFFSLIDIKVVKFLIVYLVSFGKLSFSQKLFRSVLLDCQLFGDFSSFLPNLFCGQILITSIFINLLTLMVNTCPLLMMLHVYF